MGNVARLRIIGYLEIPSGRIHAKTIEAQGALCGPLSRWYRDVLCLWVSRLVAYTEMRVLGVGKLQHSSEGEEGPTICRAAAMIANVQHEMQDAGRCVP